MPKVDPYPYSGYLESFCIINSYVSKRREEMLSTRLSKAVQKAQELPEAIQDELAEQFIEDIENEIKWQETLSKPQDSLILKELAQKAIADSENGQTQEMGFDDL
jgi:hypothetical protein